MSTLFVLWCVFQTGLPVERFPNANFFMAVQTRAAAFFCRREALSFERLLREHLHENIWEWQEIRHLSAWRAANVFQVLQRDEHEYWALQPPNPWQNLWSLAASGSHYPCHLSNKLLYWAHSWGWCCLSPGIITIILCFHSVSTGLFQLLVTILLAWFDLSEVTEEDFQTIDARYRTLASFLVFLFLFHKGPRAELKPQSKTCLKESPTNLSGHSSSSLRNHPVFNSAHLAVRSCEFSARN